MVLLLTAGLVPTSMAMLRMKSMERDLAAYRMDPGKGTFIQKYFFGYAIWNGKITELNIRMIGDKLWSAWLKVVGVIFLFFTLAFWVGVVVMWGMFLTGN